MRYRPFGATSTMAVSAVSLLLSDRARMSAKDWRALLEAAMIAGINTFELSGTSDALLDGLGQSVAALERRLVFVSWRAPVGVDPVHAVRGMLGRLDLTYLDMLILAEAGQLPGAQALKQARIIRQIGMAGADDLADQAVELDGVDALITPYSLASGSRERHRLKRASDRNMAVVVHDVWPEILRQPPSSLIPKALFQKAPRVARRSGYQFLGETWNWTPEELCLAYALTEPSITSARIEADDAKRIIALAAVPEREMPTGVAAQIEMARFSTDRQP
jgi:hypothetical protein